MSEPRIRSRVQAKAQLLNAAFATVLCGLSAVAPWAAPALAQDSPPAAWEFDLRAHPLGGMRAQVATLLVQGGRGGGIATELLAVPVGEPGEGDGERLVPVLVEIEGPTLLAAHGDEAEGAENGAGRSDFQRVEIYVYALNPSGGVEDFINQVVYLDLDAFGERVYASGLKLVSSLSLPPGPYSVRMLVMDADSGQYGLRTVPLAVPAPDTAATVLLAPLVAEPPGSWLLVRQDVTPPASPTDAETTAPTTEPVPPERAVRSLLLGRDETLPSAFPLFDSGAEVEMHLLAHGLGRQPEVTVKLTPQEGGDPHVVPMEVVARLGTQDPKIERLSGRFTVPNLPTGAFLLSIATEEDRGRAETGQIRALVLQDNPLGEQLVWGQLRSAAAQIQHTAEAGSGARGELDLPRRHKKRVKALQRATLERYAQTLAKIGSGASGAEVVEALAAMETELFEADPAEGLPALERGELALAEQLAQTEPESLVPLIGFHLDLYLHYRRERSFALATHSRHTTVKLAEMYAEAADTDSARTIASQALTTLATEMLDAGLRNSGGAALEKALKLDEQNEAARLQIAAHHERLGRYRAAVDALRKLVERNPKSAEGRLRLALNLRRVGELHQAETALGRLVSESNPDWILTVAYTELAGLYLEQSRNREAVILLRRAMDRLPEQDRLYIQLAYALDRQRRFLEARRILSRVAGREHHLTNGRPSPRHRYAKGTAQGLAAARDRVLEAARTRQPLLSATLDRLTDSRS